MLGVACTGFALAVATVEPLQCFPGAHLDGLHIHRGELSC